MTSASPAASVAAPRPVRQAGSPIHVVQITDFHLHSDPDRTMMGINTDESLRAVIDSVREKHGTLDLLLLTGDLAQEPTVQTYQRLRRHLETLPAPCYCLPGNHDDSRLIRELLTRGTIACESRILTGGWQIICLDSTVPNEAGGYLPPRQLDLLERLLADQPERYALICLHHSPLPTGSQWLDTMRLCNADELFALLDRYPNVMGSIFGHIHQALDVMRGRLRLLASPSTCFQFKPYSADFALDELPPGYRWLKLYPNGEIETGVERLADVPAGLDITSAGY